MTRGIAREPYATMPDGRLVTAYTLTGAQGLQVRFIEYGGIILSIRVPDRRGARAAVTLGHDTLAEYARDTHYTGALVGRYANRIARGRFTIDGTEHAVTVNDGPHHLHGGATGMHKAFWTTEVFEDGGKAAALLRCTSPDGDEGFPGTVAALARYTLTDDNALAVDFAATTDRPTPVNLTQHSYFNLAGPGHGILGHELTIHADRFTPVDAALIPTGELRAVRGTPFDFATPAVIGARIGAPDEQLGFGGGYDHNFALDHGGCREPELAARLYEPVSGRVLEVLTTQPGLQFYSGNSLGRREGGPGGRAFARREGLALEPQHFPDSPNRPEFPSTLLRPGEQYAERIVYRFSVA